MVKDYDTKHIFLAIAICIGISAPVFLVFVPQVIANILYQTRAIWHMYVPGNVYWVYGIGFLLLFLAVFLPYVLNVNKISIVIAILFVPLSMFLFYAGSQAFQSLSDDEITYREIFSSDTHTYQWEDLQDIQYITPEKGPPTYEFVFQDGNTLTFRENGYLKSTQLRIIHKARAIGIDIEK